MSFQTSLELNAPTVWGELEKMVEDYAINKSAYKVVNRVTNGNPQAEKVFTFAKGILKQYKEGWRDGFIDLTVDTVAFKSLPLPLLYKGELLVVAKAASIIGHRYEQSLKAHKDLFSEESLQEHIDTAVMMQVPWDVFVAIRSTASKTIKIALDHIGLTQDNIEKGVKVVGKAFRDHNPDAEEATLWGSYIPKATEALRRKTEVSVSGDKKDVSKSVARMIQEGKKIASDPAVAEQIDPSLHDQIDAVSEFLKNYKKILKQQEKIKDLTSMQEGFDRLAHSAMAIGLDSVALSAQCASMFAGGLCDISSLEMATSSSAMIGPMASLAAISLSVIQLVITQDRDDNGDFIRYLTHQFEGLRQMIRGVYDEVVATRKEMREGFFQVKELLFLTNMHLEKLENLSKREFSFVKDLIVAEFRSFEKQLRDVSLEIGMQLRELTFDPLYARIEKVDSYSVAAPGRFTPIDTLLDDAEFFRHWIMNPPSRKILQGSYWIEADVSDKTLLHVLSHYPQSALIGLYVMVMVKYKIEGYKEIQPHLDSLINVEVAKMILPAFEKVVDALAFQGHQYDPSYEIRKKLQKGMSSNASVIDILQKSYSAFVSVICEKELFPLLDQMKEIVDHAFTGANDKVIEARFLEREERLRRACASTLSSVAVSEKMINDDWIEGPHLYSGFQSDRASFLKSNMKDVSIVLDRKLTESRKVLLEFIDPWAIFNNTSGPSLCEGDFILPLTQHEIMLLIHKIPISYLQNHALGLGRLSIEARIHEPISVVPASSVSGAPYKSWWQIPGSSESHPLNIALVLSYQAKEGKVAQEIASDIYTLENLERNEWAKREYDPSSTWYFWSKNHLTIAIHSAWKDRVHCKDRLKVLPQRVSLDDAKSYYAFLQRDVIEKLSSQAGEGLVFQKLKDRFDANLSLLKSFRSLFLPSEKELCLSSSDLLLKVLDSHSTLFRGDQIRKACKLFFAPFTLQEPIDLFLSAKQTIQQISLTSFLQLLQFSSFLKDKKKQIASCMTELEKRGQPFSLKIDALEEEIEKGLYDAQEQLENLSQSLAGNFCGSIEEDIIIKLLSSQQKIDRSLSELQIELDLFEKKVTHAASSLEDRTCRLEEEMKGVRGDLGRLREDFVGFRSDVMDAFSSLQKQLSGFFDGKK